ncbi:protein FAR-RED IMPAIRED RESPONSE 1-like [Actinidia eriantha]|uniref:protein FAR-RED IMPAIRED RESPONSE 1-like n=1 Tax=Actinidia eriantha TaxID=165200 RepID=UPI00258E7043|nr:protein FAR-RED IMPAIRED RESPONSE 1-like [Actinidia eriantha]
MCPMSSQVEWDEEAESWSVDIGEEEDVLKESVMKDCVNNKEVNGNFKERVEEPKMGMKFDTHDEAYLYYTRFAKEKRFALAKRSSKKENDGMLKHVIPSKKENDGMLKHVILQCSRGGKPRPKGNNPAQSNRALDENMRRKLVLHEQAGIRLNKTVTSLHIEAGGLDKVPYLPRDCRNYLDKFRRLQLAKGDAEAMHRYFMRMRGDNADFFYAMGLNKEGRLRNVLWADARSRAACKEFGDIVTFDTTYLVNKYDMPFAPFVGVNHHGQSILLGCGLISHEDTESFSWLFQS